MLNIAIYFSIIGFLAITSYTLFNLAESMIRTASGVLREISSVVTSIILFSITALIFAKGEGYPAISRDGLVMFLGISGILIGWLNHFGKYNAVAINTERKFASLMILAVVVCFTVIPNFIPDFKIVRWHWLSGLMGIIAFGLVMRINRQGHSGFAKHLIFSKKAKASDHPALLLIWIAIGIIFYGLALYFLGNVSFDVNTSLSISDTSFALILTLPLALPVLIRAYRVGIRHSVPFASNFLTLYIASVSLGVMTILTLASTINGVDVFFAITNAQLSIVFLSLAALWQVDQSKSSLQPSLCGYAAAALLISQFI